MSEHSTPNTVPEQTPAAAPEQGQTPPQAATVDMDAITKTAERLAEKKAAAVVTDMLRQQGLDDKTVGQMVAEWKSRQQTPEQAFEQALSQKDNAIQSLEQKAADLETQLVVLRKGVPEEDVDDYLAIAQVRVRRGEADTLDAALDLVLQKNPIRPQQEAGADAQLPSFAARTPPAAEQPGLAEQYGEAMKQRNTAEAIRIKQEAFAKGIVL